MFEMMENTLFLEVGTVKIIEIV